MRDGIRKQIFHTLVAKLPYHSSMMVGMREVYDSVIERKGENLV